MTKVLKILARIIGITLEWSLLLVVIFAFAIRTSAFQTYLGKLATKFLTEELHAEFRISKIDVVFFDKVYLKDVLARDRHGDTLAALGQITLRVRSINIQQNKFVFKSLGLYNGKVGLERDSLSGKFNFQFIVDYFKSDKKKSKKKIPSFFVDKVNVEYVDFSYDDFRKPKIPYGIDYAHMHYKHLVLHSSNFQFVNKITAFKLDFLQAHETSGFWLKKLNARAIIHPRKGVLLSDVAITTSRSKIYASRLNMLMSSLKGFKTFVDSVKFDAVLDSSSVSLWDVSQFAHALEGMNNIVLLKASVQNEVKNLAINNMDLRFGTRSVVRGDYSLPDFRMRDFTKFNEQIDYALIDFSDVEQINLPKKANTSRIRLAEMIDRLEYAEFQNTRLIGDFNQFTVKSDKLQSKLGSVHLLNDITFTKLPEGGYAFNRTDMERYDMLVDSFNLAAFLNNPILGKTSGQVFLSGVVGQKDMIRIETLAGDISYFQFKNYGYTNIKVKNGSFIDKKLNADLSIDDPNLKLTYSGEIDVSKKQNFDFKTTISLANIGKLNFMDDPDASFTGDLKVDVSGASLQTMEGIVLLDNVSLIGNKQKMNLPELSVYVERGSEKDLFELRSDIIDANLSGKFDFNTLGITVNNGLADAFPSYFSVQKFPKHIKHKDELEFHATIKNAKEFLAIFVPNLHIEYGTELDLTIDANQGYQNLELTSPKISYDHLIDNKSTAFIEQLRITQDFKNGSGELTLNGEKSQLTDSLCVSNLELKMHGTKNVYDSHLMWNDGVPNPSDFDFIVDVREEGEFDIQLKPSYFSLKNNMWDIMNTARITYCEGFLEINHLMLERENQFLSINGLVSNDPEHRLTINAHDLHIDEFSSLLGVPLKMEGSLNGMARVSTPFTDIKVDGDFELNDYFIEGNEVGDVHVNGIWLDLEKKIILSGDLDYKEQKTFDFNGYILPFDKENNIDFDLEFNNMNIAFANAFIDPEVLSEINGDLKGVIKATGSFEDPLIDGKLMLKNGTVKVGILGTKYAISGPLKFDGENDGIYGMLPIKDKDGNIALANTTVFHNNFKDFSLSFDILFDESVSGFRDPITFKPLSKTKKFMVLNTAYKEGTIYYGDAYATGTANIFIEKGNTEITVNASTEKGTNVNLPLYGAKEISEFDFIDFSKDTVVSKKKLDLTGVDLKLNIHATPDANLKLILNDKTNEEIRANGTGDVSMRVDNFGQIQMTGQYIIQDGTYDFVFNPIKKVFTIDNGSSIVWTGSPYDANLNIKAYYKVNASLNDLNKEQIGGASDTKSEVRCVLNVGQTLSSPSLKLDIEVPNINESGKAVLNNIRSNNDELQKQFFTLLALNRFQGTGANSFGGVADILTQQINSALDQLSKDVKLNVNFNDNASTGNKNYQFGLQRAFGEKQNIVLRTSLGVSNNTTSGTSTNQLIGNFNLDYLINEDGSFRLSIFNESNDKSILSNKDKGEFTQGIGLHYEESFDKVKDSRIIQSIANVFRKKKRVENSKRKNRVPISVIPGQNDVVLPENE